MIGKITIGKSLRHLIHYAIEDKLDINRKVVMENRAEIICFNQCFGDKKELVQQFKEVRNLNQNLSKPAMHISLSLSPGEQLSKIDLQKIVDAAAKELGLEKHQFLAVLHKDTVHQHVHIVVNRVGFDGRTLSDSNNYKKITNCCRKLEQYFGLKQVLSPKKFLPKEFRQVPRFDQRKETMKLAVRFALLESKNYPEFEAKMRSKGFEVIKGRGISFRDEKKMYAKGSEIGYSLTTIQKILQMTLTQKQSLIRRQVLKEQAIKKGHQSQKSSLSKIVENDKAINYARAIEILLRAEYDNAQTPREFLQKKRKKKIGQSHHF